MEQSAFRRITRRILRVITRGVAVFVLLGLLLLLWTWYLNRPPHYPINPPAVPEDNALGYYQRASQTIRHAGELPGFSIHWNKLDKVSAKQALAKWEEEQSKEKNRSDSDIPPQQKSLSVARFIQQDETALQFIREALDRKYVLPFSTQDNIDAYYKRGLDTDYQIQDCRRLLELNAVYQFSSPNARVAADALVDYLYFNTVMFHNRRYQRSIGCSQLEAMADELSAPDAHAIVARLEKVCQSRPSFAESLNQARPYVLYQMSAYLNDTEYCRWYTNRWILGIPNMHPSPLEDRSLMVNQFYAWTVSNSAIPRITDRYLTQCIRVAEQPFSAHAKYPSPPRDIFNWQSYGWNEYDITNLQWQLWAFQQDGLMLSMAIHGYRKEHNHYPANLKDLLADGWVKNLPVDPYTLKDTICYHNQGKKFILYSRGPDGDDDDGKTICTVVPPHSQGNSSAYISYTVLLNSKGDVVYGINNHGQENSNSDRI